MQPRGKHPLQRIPTWVALSVGVIIGFFISRIFTGVSTLLIRWPVHPFPVAAHSATRHDTRVVDEG